MNAERLNNLRKAMRSAGLQAVCLNPGPTLVHLSGLQFHLMERPVVALFCADGRQALVLPELEMPKLAGRPELAGFPYPEDPAAWPAVFRQAAASLGLDGAAIGVEPRRLRLLEYNFVLHAAPGAKFPDASEVLSSLRLRKDASEIEAMQKAVDIAQQALLEALKGFRVGMTEQELASELTLQLLRSGSTAEIPFSPIVSGGPNGANPHAAPGSRPIQPGDLLVIDWGAAADGYISDLTRTFAVGQVEEEYRRIAGIVQQANQAGREAARPGATCAAVDIAARRVIEQAGYGQYFTHRTGHGIGMEGHEEPYMRGDNQQLLEPGMAFTVEPGIYLPGRNGVRIEDDLVITTEGARCLSSLPRELAVIG